MLTSKVIILLLSSGDKDVICCGDEALVIEDQLSKPYSEEHNLRLSGIRRS